MSGLPLSRHAPAPARPAFYFDFTPESYLVAERILPLAPVPTEWVPVRASALPHAVAAGGPGGAEERAIWREALERTALQRGLQPMRWPAELPFDSTPALRAATFARSIGKGVAFALAAFRQAFAGGRDLSSPDTVIIAAAACEMHPRAILGALEQRSVATTLEEATTLAGERGVTSLPAVWTPPGGGAGGPVPSRVFPGDDALEAAAAHMAEHLLA